LLSETLRKYGRQVEADEGLRPDLPRSEERDEIKALRKEVYELHRAKGNWRGRPLHYEALTLQNRTLALRRLFRPVIPRATSEQFRIYSACGQGGDGLHALSRPRRTERPA
jgi:hypothetical protein